MFKTLTLSPKASKGDMSCTTASTLSHRISGLEGHLQEDRVQNVSAVVVQNVAMTHTKC